MIARPVSGNPINEFSVHIRISEHKLSSQPPPNAGPSITDIVGHYIFSKAINVYTIFLLNWTNYSGLISFLSFRSAPAQNIPGSADASITQFAES